MAPVVDIPAMMKACVVEGPGKLSIKEVPVPEPKYGQVLIKIITSGVCHTDLHVLDGDWTNAQPNYPIIPGHEGAGVVAKVGEGVTNLKVGDRVGSAWLHDSCMACEHCLAGWETVCAQQHQTGFAADGCFAEYTIARAEYVGKIPDALPYSQASPILCAGVTTYKALKESRVKPMEWVAIHGASGGLGHVAVQYAKAMGMKVLAIDFGADRLKYCMSIGADKTVDAGSDDVIAAVREAVPGGPHGVVVVAPSLVAYEQAAKYLRARGTVVVVSLPAGDFKINPVDFVLGAKDLKASIVGTRLDLQEALNIAAGGNVTATLVEDKVENIPQILTDMKAGKIRGRVVIRFAPDE